LRREHGYAVATDARVGGRLEARQHASRHGGERLPRHGFVDQRHVGEFSQRRQHRVAECHTAERARGLGEDVGRLRPGARGEQAPTPTGQTTGERAQRGRGRHLVGRR
jgi:hypothetical protein